MKKTPANPARGRAAREREGRVADPARSLALLWGSHGKPGRSGLTVRAIVEAAIALADASGLDAVSMRQLADVLQVGTMSLYTHVPGKVELTELMVDTVYGHLYDDVDAPSRRPGGWRAALEYVATRNWDLYQRHPWLLEIVSARPVLGPNASLKYEAELRPLDRLGLTDMEMDSVLTLLLTHVEGTARALSNVRRTRQESGMSDVEWWVATAPLLDKVMDARRFPVAARVGQSAGQAYQGASSPEHAFRFGLERILDAVALLISARDERRGAGRA
ncbi:TetR family transcriptional regulator [Sorangium cellulosum]|uniref:TetR family transcriptional regulator n=1 Tax=Sorangium cellulosum TaxID=56 RepID=A0A4P2PZ87_SORCE|nr:TetR/AcrR family transcriptional regulator C-terminal domain-containing protein [Sorangium cellulosum]AUX21918.1 TetR family transcriptional regulator [Sorangium cellulosum]